MIANVFITARSGGEVVACREGHNVWTEFGREYLAQRVTLATHDPDTFENLDVIAYMQFGIGGNKQRNMLSVNNPPYSTSYPPGFDPNSTTGNTYREENHKDPLISSLERPVRIAGGTNDYGTIDPGDTWILDYIGGSFLTSHLTPYSVTLRGFVDATAGQIVYSPFDSVPLSEIALITNKYSTALTNKPYTSVSPQSSPCVAYHSFDTIEITDAIELEIEWTIGF